MTKAAKRWAEKKARGECFRCSSPATHGALCEEHRKKQRELGHRYDVDRYARLRANGLCTYSGTCTNPATPGKAMCPQHRDQVCDYQKASPKRRKRHNRHVRKYRRTLRNLGVCQNCGQRELDEGFSKTYCRECRLENAEALRLYARAKGIPNGTRRCGRCRKPGHRITTCPEGPARPVDTAAEAVDRETRDTYPPLRIEDFATARQEAL
jgi:hypothetical protein